MNLWGKKGVGSVDFCVLKFFSKKNMETTPAQCFRPSPSWVVKKRCVLNVNSMHDRCFAWVLLRARYPVPQHQRRVVVDLLSHLQELVLPEHVTYSIPLDQEVFQQIEALNPWCSFSVFLIGENEGEVQPFYVSQQKYRRPLHVCVGALKHPSSPIAAHYVFLRRLDFLMGKACDFQRFYCENCLQLFRGNTIHPHEKECYGLEKPPNVTFFTSSMHPPDGTLCAYPPCNKPLGKKWAARLRTRQKEFKFFCSRECYQKSICIKHF
jgi:hypothetical protein